MLNQRKCRPPLAIWWAASTSSLRLLAKGRPCFAEYKPCSRSCGKLPGYCTNGTCEAALQIGPRGTPFVTIEAPLAKKLLEPFPQLLVVCLRTLLKGAAGAIEIEVVAALRRCIQRKFIEPDPFAVQP